MLHYVIFFLYIIFFTVIHTFICIHLYSFILIFTSYLYRFKINIFYCYIIIITNIIVVFIHPAFSTRDIAMMTVQTMTLKARSSSCADLLRSRAIAGYVPRPPRVASTPTTACPTYK